MPPSPHKPRWQPPRSIAARGAILIALAAATAGVPAWMLGRGRAEARGGADAVDVALAVLLAERLGDAPADEHAAGWLPAVLAKGDALRWAAVLGPDGQGYEFRRRLAVPTEVLHGQIDRSVDKPMRGPLRIDGMVSQRFILCTWPQPEGAVLAAVIDAGPDAAAAPPGARRRLWPALAAAVGVLGLVAAVVWLRWAIERPLKSLSQQAGRVSAELSALDAAAPEELGGVVRRVAELEHEVRHWRGEAEHLRESVEGKVDARTRDAQRAQARAEREAATDALTRVESRAAFEREVPPMFAEARAADRRLALVLIDIDHFKRHNDTFGHVAGDHLLTFLGDLIRATLHTVPCRTFRYGGDEFVALLPDRAAAVVADLARRLAAMFAQHVRTLKGSPPHAALSIGIAERQADGAADWESLLKLADVAMYFAKRRGVAVATVKEVRAAVQ